MKKALGMKTLLKSCISFVVTVFTFFVKRDKRIVLCTGWYGHRFADNSRYMYQYLCDHKERLELRKVVWITQNEQIYKELIVNGLNVCKVNSIKSIYLHLRAGYFFYDQFLHDFHATLVGNGKCVNLWHGLPIKKFGLLNGLSGLNWNLGDSYLFTCTEYGDRMLGGCFQVKTGHFLHGMYPRNYYLLHDIPFLMEQEKYYLYQLQELKKLGKKVLFYLPTFRKLSGLNFLGEKNPLVLKEFLEYLDVCGYVMLAKIHFHGLDLHQDTIDIESKNLLNLPAEVDIYPFLKETDVLLTDYSSVLFDFLYLDKNIICFPYDFQQYKDCDQGLLLDYDSLPVDRVDSLSELKECIGKYDCEKTISKQKERKEWLFRCFGSKTMEETETSVFQIE